ncbi:Hypothetical protein EMIHUDRAFT_463192, partial [Emiliania huxleyi CCMP1516]|uniref:Uncharacterized protein n=2 Tax=Emiliania huxleyi TaxID=2903 RepID=A0A0D3JW94_EMIH1
TSRRRPLQPNGLHLPPACWPVQRGDPAFRLDDDQGPVRGRRLHRPGQQREVLPERPAEERVLRVHLREWHRLLRDGAGGHLRAAGEARQEDQRAIHQVRADVAPREAAAHVLPLPRDGGCVGQPVGADRPLGRGRVGRERLPRRARPRPPEQGGRQLHLCRGGTRGGLFAQGQQHHGGGRHVLAQADGLRGVARVGRVAQALVLPRPLGKARQKAQGVFLQV